MFRREKGTAMGKEQQQNRDETNSLNLLPVSGEKNWVTSNTRKRSQDVDHVTGVTLGDHHKAENLMQKGFFSTPR